MRSLLFIIPLLWFCGCAGQLVSFSDETRSNNKVESWSSTQRLQAWFETTQKTIKKNWHPSSHDQDAVVQVRFEVAKNGRVVDADVVKSSGDKAMDESALKAIRITQPFQPLPADFKDESVIIEFTFDYRTIAADR
jgi:TonB family protein